MSAASMSRNMIRTYLRLYLKNRRKIKFMKQRVNGKKMASGSISAGLDI